MKANAFSFLTIFEKKLRLEVPLFQRQYVWNQEEQWKPLWEDVARKFIEYLEGRKSAPVHFLGAMVLDQKQTPISHVDKRQIIDGQQRLTTLQIFLAAFRDLCGDKKHNHEDLAKECDSFLINKGLMAEPNVDKFKVWPTQLDREQFTDVITSCSPEVLEKKYPLTRQKHARKYDPRPRMVEAYIFFYNQLKEFFIGTSNEPPFAADQPLRLRMEESFQALKNALHVVVIDLEPDDDAQVIFETLNARGEPLLPADLLRNFIFLRAARCGESSEALYEEYWRRFDDPFWRRDLHSARLNRPRSDLFLQYFLASQQARDIPIKHLFVEYKYWVEKSDPKPFLTVRDELATIARQGDHFRRIVDPKKEDVLFSLVTFLDQFDITTVHSLLLYLLDNNLPPNEWKEISIVLESFLLRRAVCDMTTKNYNRVFLKLIQFLRSNGISSQNISKHLSELSGESVEWPKNDRFRDAWQNHHAYKTLQSRRIIHILLRLNNIYLTNKNEQIIVKNPLTVEHLLPKNWIENWLLPDGTKGLMPQEISNYQRNDPRVIATLQRNEILETLGNLTLLTQPLNSSISNNSWKDKKIQLLNASLLPINQQLHSIEFWDEQAIKNRSNLLFEQAIKIWPGPE